MIRTDYLGWTFDVTMQMMIVVQKLSMLGYNYYDGTENPKPTDDQSSCAVYGLPGILEFLGWIYMPSNFSMGPSFEFVEYRKVAKGATSKPNLAYVLQLLLIAFICLGINQVSVLYFNVDTLRDESFLKNNSPLYIYGYCLLLAFTSRFKKNGTE